MALVDDPLAHRFTVDEFLALAEGMDQKVELIDGVIYDVGEESADHIRIVAFVLRELWRVRAQYEAVPGGTVRLEPRGAPIPDVALYRAEADTSSRYFQAADLLLAVEVSLSTASRDRAKLGDYARAGVPEVWIIDRLQSRSAAWLRVTVHTEPDTLTAQYLTRQTFEAAEIARLEPERYIATF
jgi:Uma2 family endonuclease